jgi:hypothetical protein
LRAGLSKIDITPTQPVKMAGYESRKDPSQGVHDPLGARALVLEKDGQRLVLVSLDNLGFYNGTAEPLRQAIVDSCQLKPSELFLCAIHTHSAPALGLDPQKAGPVNVEYTRTLQGKLVEVVQAALKRLEPAQATVCFGSSPVGVNRREVVQEGAGHPPLPSEGRGARGEGSEFNPSIHQTKVVLGRNPSKMTDREVQVLRLSRPGQDKLAGVLFAYSTHSTSLGAKNYLISGDIHGIAEQFLENYYGQDVVAPGFAGASGNIDPWVRVLPDFRTNNGWLPEPVLMGTMLGEEVARVLEGPQTALTNLSIRTLLKTVALPGKVSSDSQATTNSTFSSRSPSPLRGERARGEGSESSELALTAPFNITVACLGDIAFVGWGGEVFNEIGAAVKKGSPFQHTFILTHCNGAAGYLPTPESYPEGGYEVQSSKFGPAAAEVLITETLHMLRDIHDGQ